MSYKLYLDLQKINLTSLHYTILQSIAKGGILTEVPSNCENLMILADTDDAICHWQAQNLPVIAWSHEYNASESLMKSSWMILSLDALTDQYLEEVFCHFHGIPLTILETPRCFLRELCQNDLAQLVELEDSQEQDSAGRFFRSCKNDTLSEREHFLQEYVKHQYSFYGFGFYGAFEKEQGTFLGIAGFYPSKEVELEIGYAVAKENHNQGYATEWVKSLMEYAKVYLEIENLAARITEDNLPSMSVARKSGLAIIVEKK